jgi:hypothetical protein
MSELRHYYQREDGSFRDSRGRLSGSDAIQALLEAVDPDILNTWMQAEDVVQNADDGTARAALTRLLALHLHSLNETEPHVAVRNMQTRDLVRLAGVPYRVIEITMRGDRGQTGYIRARLDHQPDSKPLTFIHNEHDRFPLIERPAPVKGGADSE